MINSSTQYNSTPQPCCFIFDVMGWRLILIKMSGFKTRLIEEKAQLQEKTEKLEAFLTKSEPLEIAEVQETILRIQLNAMKTYNQCLAERLLWLDK